MSSRLPRDPTRRRFVQGLAAGGLVGGFTLPAWSTSADRALASPATPTLTGTDLELRIGAAQANFTGRVRPAIVVNGSLPAPILRLREGDTVTLRVRNDLPADAHHSHQTSIHWHGILLPANMDGVPGLSFDGIGRGESWAYRFTLRQSGTYWYHSHSGFQEQAGLYGALIVDPREPDPVRYDRDHVVVLSDWTDLPPDALFRRLKKMPMHDNYYQRTVGDAIRDIARDGLAATLRDRKHWGEMRMTPSDISDVNAHTYTYLMNGTTSLGNWTGLFRSGERVRLRFINAGAMTYFDVRIPGLKLTVVAADGQNVHPVTVDEFRIAPAETYDVVVEPSGQDAYTIFAQDMGRTGYVSGTLAVRTGLRAPAPAIDPRPLLTMADMGHGGHAGHAGHDASSHAGMQHDAMPHAASDRDGMPDKSMPDHSTRHGDGEHGDSGQDTHRGHRQHADHGAEHGSYGSGMQAHPASEGGNPLVDMQTTTPSPKLDDPGIGLRDNGRRVLRYGDLRSLFDDPDGRDPGRDIELHLTGHMEKFSWSFDGIPFAGAAPLRLNYGERMRIVLVNDTMMTHPIHLHGMWSDVETADHEYMVRKHTVDMPPGTRRSFRVRADALGRWAFHCHLLYHMESGMMREVRVEE